MSEHKCVNCGKPALYEVFRTHETKKEIISMTDEVCESCLEVYKKWKKEERLTELEIKKIEQ